MKFPVLLLIASTFCACALTENVDTRKPGRQWNYYGDLLQVYRDENRGRPVAMVWLDQVGFQRVSPSEFRKAVALLLTQGYRKIGFVSVRSRYFVDPYEAKKLAADKGAGVVVGCWFSVRATRASSPTIEYWYQLLGKGS